jgi:hypothetical protein
MIPARYDIVIYQGATFYLPFAIEGPDGVTLDPTTVGDDYEIGRMVIISTDGDVIDELSTDSSEIVLGAFTDTDGNNWSGYILIDAATTAAYEEWGEGRYDLEIDDELHVERVLMGVARLSPEAA